MRKKRLINVILLLIAIVALFLSGYLYYRLDKLKNNIPNEDKEIKSLINKIGKLYLLPVDEIPTVATVKDPEILKIFNLAQKGDNVLIYTKYGKAILYRPDIDKIIEVVSIKVGSLDNDFIE